MIFDLYRNNNDREDGYDDTKTCYRGIYWKNLSVRSFLGTQMLLYPSTGEAFCGQILCLLGDNRSGKSLLLEALTNNLDKNHKRHGYCQNLSAHGIFISEINRLFSEELTIMENLRLAENTPISKPVDMHDIMNVFASDLKTKAKNLPIYKKHVLSLYIAYILNKPVVIHDDPFKHVRSANKLCIINMLNRLKRDRRVVVIGAYIYSMDNETIKHMDDYCYMLSSKIVNKGKLQKYAELIKAEIFSGENLEGTTDLEVVGKALHKGIGSGETREAAYAREQAVVAHWDDMINTTVEPPFVHCRRRQTLFSQISSFVPEFLKLVFTKKINLLVYLITLLVPELVTIGLAFMWSGSIFYNLSEIEISTKTKTFFFPEGYVDLSNEDLALISRHLDSLKVTVTLFGSERYAELVDLTNFISNYVASKMLMLYILRYMFITQYVYVGYFFKNVLMQRSKHCNFIGTEQAIVTFVTSRIPNLLLEYATNLFLFKKLLFLETHVVSKYAIVHTLLFLILDLFTFHLLRFSTSNIGLIFYKGILFGFILLLTMLNRNFRFFLSQLLICHVLSVAGREIVAVLALLVVSLFLICTGLFM